MSETNPYESPEASPDAVKADQVLNRRSVQKVPFGQKLAFGFGMLANQMFPAALGIFFVLLIDGGKFSPLLWGLLAFLPRIFDAVTDPIMGFISDNTRSKWGRRRQYVLVGGLILGASYIAMWQLWGENGETFNFVYFLVCSLVFYLGLTIFSVPYVAMGYEMSDDFHERTNIMAVAQFVGQWAWVIVPWFWVIIAKYDDPEVGVRQMAIWVAIPCTVFALVPAFLVKSPSTVDRDDFQPINLRTMGSSLGEIFKSTLEALAIPQFRRLAIATFLIFNSFEIIAGFTYFIIVHHLFNSDGGAAGNWPAIHGCVGALITTFLVIPLVAIVSKKIGKKKTFILSQAISIIGYILFWFLFIPGKPYLFLFALPFHSFGIGGLFTLMMSMTADVCDIDELNTGKRREGILGAVYWWMVKFGKAFAGLLAGVILWLVAFDGGNVTESAMTGIRVFYTALPIVGVIGAVWMMWGYDISETKAEEVRRQLDARRVNASTNQNSS